MDLKIFTDNIEPEAQNQVYTLAKHPAFQDAKIRIMPDVHAGKGCVIGFTANLGEKVVPNLVGVDIGCSMLTTRIKRQNIDFEKLDNVIHQYIPSGRNARSDEKYPTFRNLEKLRCFSKLKNVEHIHRSIGTLGGGNHFIELDKGFTGAYYLVIHSGSRNLGKQVAEYYQNLAIDQLQNPIELQQKKHACIDELKANGQAHLIQETIAKLQREYYAGREKLPRELAYLTGSDREDYLHDMYYCQQYATKNREFMANEICYHMGWKPVGVFETMHNYIDLESNIVRKGAISAKKGEIVLIPINMRDGCILARGKGNEDWNQSAPHGAGRVLSRSKAKEQLSLENYEVQMQNIYTTSVSRSTLDEAPEAYKPIQEILDRIKDTVEVIEILKPVYNFKAND